MRDSTKSKINDISGQSLIEFILTLFSFMTVLFMVVQVSLGFGVSNYLQYATFMAARALLSSGATVQDQVNRATAVLRRYVGENGDRFQGIIEPKDGGDPRGATVKVIPTPAAVLGSEARNRAWKQGVSFKFKARMYMLPIVRSTTGAQNFVDLESQSWLGREPSEQECLSYIQSKNGIAIDNGC